jgi:hypothetical protein
MTEKEEVHTSFIFFFTNNNIFLFFQSSNNNILIQIKELNMKWDGNKVSDDEYLNEMTQIIKGEKH